MAYSFSNAQITQIFEEILAALVVQNDDRFRIRAYDNAVTIFSQLQDPIESYWKQKTLTTIPGIGSIFAQKIDELFTTGKIKEFNEIKSTLPEGMFELIKVEGIGPKNAFKLANKFKLIDRSTAVEKLIQAASEHNISKLDGFGVKSEAQMLDNLSRFKNAAVDTKILLYRADQIANEIEQYVSKIPEVEKFSTLGSHRRRKETLSDIDIGIAAKEAETVSAKLVTLPKVNKVVAQGNATVRVVWGEGIDVDFKLVNPTEWGSLLQHFTGSKAHNVALREMAIKKNMSMSEHGMKIEGSLHRYSSENDFYNVLGLDWIPPELRENQGEIEASLRGELPTLVKKGDIVSDLHTHTNYNWINSHDAGQSSVDELADQAVELGYQYIGIGDHNPSQSSYSYNEIIKQVQKRSEYIEQINRSYEKRVKKGTIKMFKTLEIDIKPNGEIALPNEALDYLDYAIVSIHSSFKQTQEETTRRILQALSYPKVKILGHPTGRLIDKREPINANWDEIFKYCAEHKKALEINASPDRLDLPAPLVKKAIEAGVMVSINTDAHHHSSLKTIQSGVDVARRGWATSKNVINTWSLEQFSNWLKK